MPASLVIGVSPNEDTGSGGVDHLNDESPSFFSMLKKCDSKTLVLNLGHVLFISLAPFTASLIGHYEKDQVANNLFSANLGLASLSLVFLHQYVASKTEGYVTDAGPVWVTLEWWIVYFGPLLAIASIIASFCQHRSFARLVAASEATLRRVAVALVSDLVSVHVPSPTASSST